MTVPTTQSSPGAAAGDVRVGPLQEEDLDEADRVMRVAFGTFLGAPDPVQVFGDAQYVRPRFRAEPAWAFAARGPGGELLGSNFATRWGSYGFFGPLTVRVDAWGRGLASALMQPIMELFEQWSVRQGGLFTFPQSPRHIGLYQKFGFWPQHLTALLEKDVRPNPGIDELPRHARLLDPGHDGELSDCRTLTDLIFDGLDLTHEIRATQAQRLGAIVLTQDGAELDGFAVCHLGAGEAGSGSGYIKFAAVRPGPLTGERFERLLEACESLAAHRGLSRLVAGVNTARHDAYRRLLARNYRPWLEGVLMQRPNEPGYARPDAYVIDDLR
jgi:GNAT superfamily N-acetyltransferase